ncbi:hypothetical protein Tco_1387097 [Tanacetum coccineum]
MPAVHLGILEEILARSQVEDLCRCKSALGLAGNATRITKKTSKSRPHFSDMEKDEFLIHKDGLAKRMYPNHWKGENALYFVGLARLIYFKGEAMSNRAFLLPFLIEDSVPTTKVEEFTSTNETLAKDSQFCDKRGRGGHEWKQVESDEIWIGSV